MKFFRQMQTLLRENMWKTILSGERRNFVRSLFDLYKFVSSQPSEKRVVIDAAAQYNQYFHVYSQVATSGGCSSYYGSKRGSHVVQYR